MKPSGQMTTRQTKSSTYLQLTILLFVCVATGFNQGLLLPLLTVMLEKSGNSAGMNGLNSTALYIGVFATMFFIRRPVAAFGYRSVIAVGLLLAAAAAIAFPLWQSVGVWFALRLIVGIGDSALHYSTQLWIITSAPENRRGRFISLYGMCYGIGFSIGPLGLNLLPLGEIVPFAVMSAAMLAAFFALFALPNEYPETGEEGSSKAKGEVGWIYRTAWLALAPAFLYGYMEASMNSSFPIYGLRVHLSEPQVSILLLSLGIGSLILQLPLGHLSDKIGRKPVILAAGTVGALAFFSVPLAGGSFYGMLAALLLAGGFVGSFYSLGLAYAADCLPKHKLPTANVIASIHFSIGSIAGPYLGGLGIEHVALSSIFILLGGMFALYVVGGALFHRPARLLRPSQPSVRMQ
jgi:MFS family permease